MTDQQASEGTGLSIDNTTEDGTVEEPQVDFEGTIETEIEPVDSFDTETGQALLAGKFKTQEDLEKSYLELQKKMSSDPGTGAMDMSGFLEHVGLSAEEVAVNFQADGMLTEDQYNKFQKAGISKDVVDIFMHGQSALANAAQTSVSDAVGKAYEMTGGQAALENMLAWASNTMDDTRKEALNVRLDNPATMESAVKELLYDYKQAVGSGYTQQILTGDQVPNTAAGYTTVDEFTAAIRKINDAGHLDEATRRRIANTPNHITQGLN